MRVVLVCVFGMSTYFVVKAIEQAAKVRGEDVVLEALPVSELGERIAEFDLVLLGPQVSFKREQVEAIAAKAGKKMLPIPPALYSPMDGEKLLDLILQQA